MKIKTVCWSLKFKDLDGNRLELTDLPDKVKEEITEMISMGYTEGDEEYEDDSDEMAEFNKGDEMRDFRKDQS